MAGRFEDGVDLVETHEINVTPFIDVMLVLLVIFMIAAPLSTVDVPIDLPSSTAPPGERIDRPVTLTIRSDLSLHVGEHPVADPDLATAIEAATAGDREQRIFLRADAAVSYGDLTDVMNRLRAAGYAKVALVGLEAMPGGPGGAGP
jgi:biopolymer transport protein ExbD